MRGFFTLDPFGKETAGGQDGSHGLVNHTNVGLAIERLLRRWTGVWRAQGVGCAARRDWPGPVASGTMASMPDQRRITDSGGTSWRRRVDQACLRDGRQRFKRRACSPNLDCALSSSCITPTTPRPMRGTGWRKKKRPNSVRGSDAAESIHEGPHISRRACAVPSPVQVQFRADIPQGRELCRCSCRPEVAACLRLPT